MSSTSTTSPTTDEATNTTSTTTYTPPTVWKYENSDGSKMTMNRPTAGARFVKELPVGKHLIQLYSLGTPNGQKVTILLEELLEVGIKEADYDAWLISIMECDQFGSEFVDLNPNSKIPAMRVYDSSSPPGTTTGSSPPPLKLFESGSILLYLAERFNMFLPKTQRTEIINWLFWSIGSAPFLGGGFGHFYVYADVKQKYPIDRYAMETKRQLDVLNQQLANQQYVVGDTYTLADIAIFPWWGELVLGKIYGDAAIFLNVDEEYPHVIRWATDIKQRPAVQRGMLVNCPWAKPNGLKERHDASDFEQQQQETLEDKNREALKMNHSNHFLNMDPTTGLNGASNHSLLDCLPAKVSLLALSFLLGFCLYEKMNAHGGQQLPFDRPPGNVDGEVSPIDRVKKAFDEFRRTAPAVTQIAILTTAVSYGINVLLLPKYTLECIPHFIEQKYEIYRLLTSLLVNDDLFSTLVACYMLAQHGRTLEEAMGSSTILWLSLGVFTLLVNILYCLIQIVLAGRLLSSNTSNGQPGDHGEDNDQSVTVMYWETPGIWTAVLGVVAVEARYAAAHRPQRTFCNCVKVSTKLYPLCLLLMTILFINRATITLCIATGLGYFVGLNSNINVDDTGVGSINAAPTYLVVYLDTLFRGNPNWIGTTASIGPEAWVHEREPLFSGLAGPGSQPVPNQSSSSRAADISSLAHSSSSAGQTLGGASQRNVDARTARLQVLERQHVV